LQRTCGLAPTAFSIVVAGQTINCPAGTHGFNAIARTCDPADDNGHGTHVAGIIGAVGNNGYGISGVNQSAKMIALKFSASDGSGFTSDAVAALEFARKVKAYFGGAGGSADIRILNCSWGSSGDQRTH
jgi:subtilisin family serine protease